MVRITGILLILLVFIWNCSPSPRYTVNRVGDRGSAGESGDKISTSVERPSVGSKIKGLASFYAHDFHGKTTSNG